MGFGATGISAGTADHCGNTRHRGSSTDNTGATSSATTASSQTKWRAAAARRRSATAATVASSRIAAPLTAPSASITPDAPNGPVMESIVPLISTAFLSCPFDQGDQPLALVGG